MRRAPESRLSRSRCFAAAALAAATLLAAAPAAAARPVVVTVGSRPVAPPVASDFLGLSFEVGDIARIGAFGDRGNLVGFLRALGPGILRLGGTTADTRAAWALNGAIPAWASSAVTPPDLDRVARLSRRSGWRVLLTVNFGHFDPSAMQQEVSYAATVMGSQLAGIEFGNEPDALAMYGLRPRPWTFAQYKPQVDVYREAMRAVAPTVAFTGPDQASGARGLGWLAGEAAFEHPSLLLAHYYPLAWCAGYVPVLGDLVSPGMHRAEDRMLRRIAAVSRRHAIPLRVDETNNISCAGEPGVSNTFSASLWAADFLARAMTFGIAGVNFHGHVANAGGYAPLAALTPDALRAMELTARPEWYAMLLARQLLGDRPLGAVVHGGSINATAYAFTSPRRQLHLLIVNDRPATTAPLRVVVPVGRGFGSGVAMVLAAPTLGASDGVQLGGRSVDATGRWAPGVLQPVAVAHGKAHLLVSPTSALLVSLPPRPRR